jgi:hypothetical protein
MRTQMLSLVLASAMLTASTGLAFAQSPYSYPWCSRQTAGKSDATSCYFTSYQQCMTTISGIGGWCYQSPYYHGPSAPRQAAATSRHRRYH